MIISIDILLYRIVKHFEESANIVSLGMRIDIESRQTIRFTPLITTTSINGGGYLINTEAIGIKVHFQHSSISAGWGVGL